MTLLDGVMTIFFGVIALCHLGLIACVFWYWHREFGETPPVGAVLIPMVCAPVFAVLAVLSLRVP